MPLYEFYCSDCRERFERLITYAASEHNLICPSCQGTRVRKLFSVFATSGRGGSDSAGDYDDSGDFGGGCSCGGACSCGGH